MSTDNEPDGRHKTKELTKSSGGGTDMSPGSGGGEDEGSAPVEGDDDHLHEDRKPFTK